MQTQLAEQHSYLTAQFEQKLLGVQDHTATFTQITSVSGAHEQSKDLMKHKLALALHRQLLKLIKTRADQSFSECEE